MTRRIALLTLLLSSIFAQATVCVERTFKYENITLYLCQNHSNYHETTTLLLKARAKLLDKFIGDLIEENKLDKKKFEIQIWDGLLTYNHIMVSKSSNAYFVSFSGYPSFEDLAEIVYYFAQEDWTSFVYDPEKVDDLDKTRKKIEELISQYTLPDLSKYESEKEILWQLDNLTLTYHHDSIAYYEGNQLLKYKPTSNLPVKVKDRYLFFQADSIFVYKDTKELLQFQTSQRTTSQDYTNLVVHRKWVNIGFLPDHYLYSYSYFRNRFFNLTKN